LKYLSTKGRAEPVSLREAVLKGMPDDGGLFFPEHIPRVSTEFLREMDALSFQEISLEVARLFFSEDISEEELEGFIRNSITFDAPLKRVKENVYSLELFFGPTLAFKDFGARFMAEMVSYFAKKEGKKLTVLVATSGDTGSAVANAFYQKEGIEVFILYPSGKISKNQELQITTYDKNITALEIKGTFDDCQRLVKTAFLDRELNDRLNLTSANSINIARLIPQSFYYFYGFSQLKGRKERVIISVPSGNFGNLTAGIIAKKMGLPIHKFVASTNINDAVPLYLKTGRFEPKESKRTISSAMDVGDPSNFARILYIYGNDLNRIREDIVGWSFDDEETKDTIGEVYQRYDYLLDPHGAVAFLGLSKAMEEINGASGIFLETAHPAKFFDIIELIIKRKVELPSGLREVLSKRKRSIILSRSFSEFKGFLLETTKR